MPEAPRIVVIAPFVPAVEVDNAGQRYLGELARVLPPTATFIVPAEGRSRRDAERVGDPRVILVEPALATGSTSRVTKLGQRIRHRLVDLRVRDGFWEGLRDNRRARNAIARADVIDLQWPEFVTLAPRIRRVAPGARLIATMHDVRSQGDLRELRAATSAKRRLTLALAYANAMRVERDVTQLADLLLVFSNKDRELLPEQARVMVVHPPATLAWEHRESAPSATVPHAPRDHRILSIGPLVRPENREALAWFVDHVLPLVHRRLPEARLVHAGSFDERHVEQFGRRADLELLGFVPDLAALQREVGVTVAPTRSGAGVKFKVVDALFEGTPIVGTSVAVEGIGDGDFQPAHYDEPEAFADAVVAMLTEPDAARAGTDAATVWARHRYGWAQFERTVRAAYGLPPREAVGGTGAPLASVVIPVRNGEAGLPDALEALARQDEARHLEIVVADNGSSDRTAEVAMGWADAFHSVRVADASTRAGVNHARNTGITAASCDRVLVCDHDDEARRGWVRGLLRGLDVAAAAGGLAVSRVLSGEARAIEREFEDEAVHDGPFGYLPYVAGGSMGVQRIAALAVGGFDESFVRGHDEVEFCWRLQRAGYSIVGAPDAVLDYRQRRRAIDAGRQRYHSARTRLQLWTRYADLAPLQPVSFTGAARHLAGSLREVPRVVRRETRFDAARNLGWALGTVAGHLKYRLLGEPSAALTLAADEAKDRSA